MSDKTYNRNINIYINGKEVENNIISIKKEMYNLTNQVAKAKVGSKEYNEKAAELKRVRGILKEHQENISANKSAWDKAKTALTGFIGKVAGIAGAAVGAWKGIKAIIDTTEGLSDRWDKLVGGAKEMFFEFKQSVANIDFSNFIGGLTEAYERGKMLAEQLDSLADFRAYNDYKIAALNRESRALQEIIKDKELDIKVREQSANEREKKEQEIFDRTKILAERAFLIEKQTWEGRNKIAADEAIKIYEVIDSLSTDVQKRLQTAFAGATETYLGSVKQGIQSVLFGQSGADLTGISPEAIKAYSEYFKLLETGEAEVLPKLFNAFKNVDNAIAEAQERLNAVKKERSTIGLQSGRADNIPGDIINYVTESITKGMTLREMVAAQDKELKEQQSERLMNWITQVTASTEFEVELEVDKQKNLDEIRAEYFEKEKELYAEKVELAMDYASAVGNVLGKAIADGEMTAKEAAKQLILIAIDALRQYARIAIMQATIGSMTTPDSIATLGASGLARAAILTALIEAALSGVEAIVKNNLYTGGYSGWGGKYEPAGIVHKREWVANSEMVASPVTGPVIQALEQYRQTMPGYFGGGPTVASTGFSTQFMTDPELKIIMKGIASLLADLKGNGVRMNFGYREADGVRKAMDKLTDLEGAVSI